MISVEAVPPKKWQANEGRRIRLAIKPKAGDKTFDLRTVGSGTAVWAGHAVEEALRRVRSEIEGELDRLSQRPQRQVVLVIDEPERHLHPTAQEEVASWISNLVRGGVSVIVASHAVPFLNLQLGDVEYVGVLRDSQGITRLQSLSGDVLGELNRRAAELGLSPAYVIHSARGFLVVEGEHDKAVVRHFFGDKLSDSRMEILCLRGAYNKPALLELEFLPRFGLPTSLMLDNLTQETLEDMRAGKVRKLGKERQLDESLQHLLAHPSFDVVPLPMPDIFCALPESHVQRTLSRLWGVDFAGWEDLVREYRGLRRGINFKAFFRERLGIKDSATKILTAILESSPREAKVAPALEQAIKRVLAWTAKARNSSGSPNGLGDRRPDH